LSYRKIKSSRKMSLKFEFSEKQRRGEGIDRILGSLENGGIRGETGVL
jgi:hypothetical protein